MRARRWPYPDRLPRGADRERSASASGSGELDGGLGAEREVVLHALVAARLLDDEPGVDGPQVGVDLVGVEAEAQAGSFEPKAGGCSFAGLVCLGWFLHTAEYSMEIMTYWVRFLGLPDDTQAATAARLARQKVLYSGRRRFIVVLAEQVLRTRLGTPEVMAAQLEHLLELMRLPNLSVGIIPAMAERYTVAQVPFWIWDDAYVTIETVTARLEITRPDEVTMYATVFDQLRQSAVYGSQAHELISDVIADHLQHSATS